MRTLRPDMTRRMRWLLLILVPLIALTVLVHSVVVRLMVGIGVLAIAAWVLRARDG